MGFPLTSHHRMQTGAVFDASHHAAREARQSAVSLLGFDDDGAPDTTSDVPTASADGAVGIAFSTSGGADGSLLLWMQEADALHISNLLLERFGAKPADTLTQSAINALAEVGNIVASSFLNRLAKVVNASCLPSVPHLAHGDDDALQKAWSSFSDTGAWASFALPLGDATMWLIFQPDSATHEKLSA